MPVPEADLAVLLADADGRIGEVDGQGRLGVALLPDPVLHLSSRPGGTAAPRTVSSPEDLLDALVDPPGLLEPDTSALHLDVDLDMPVNDDLAPTRQADRRTVLKLDPSPADLRIMVVVGPGVVRAGGMSGLRSLSRATSAWVFNSWSAKGVERWDSPWHFGTVGLQRRDVELSHIAEADVLIVSGLDPTELSTTDLGHPVIQEVHPGQLGALCTRCAQHRRCRRFRCCGCTGVPDRSSTGSGRYRCSGLRGSGDGGRARLRGEPRSSGGLAGAA